MSTKRNLVFILVLFINLLLINVGCASIKDDGSSSIREENSISSNQQNPIITTIKERSNEMAAFSVLKYVYSNILLDEKEEVKNSLELISGNTDYTKELGYGNVFVSLSYYNNEKITLNRAYFYEYNHYNDISVYEIDSIGDYNSFPKGHSKHINVSLVNKVFNDYLNNKESISYEEYAVRFNNCNGVLLYSTTVIGYNSVPEYIGPTPSFLDPKDPENNNEFIGWDKEITGISQDTIYIAVYEKRAVTYNVNLYNNDGTLFESKNVSKDGSYCDYNIPKYINNDPTDTNEYMFVGWRVKKGSLFNTINYITEDVDFIAEFMKKSVYNNIEISVLSEEEKTAKLDKVDIPVGETSFTVPRIYDGYSIVCIGENAIIASEELLLIYIPNSIKSVDGKIIKHAKKATVVLENNVYLTGVSEDNFSVQSDNLEKLTIHKDIVFSKLVTVDGLTYLILDDTCSKKAFVVKCNSSSSYITIQNTILDDNSIYQVVGLKKNAFSNISDNVVVNIPSSVIYAETNSFADCSGVTINFEGASLPYGYQGGWNGISKIEFELTQS